MLDLYHVWRSMGLPRGPMELLAYWKGGCGRSRNLEIWQAIPHCLLWCLWRERNARCFEGREQQLLDLKWMVLRTLVEWMDVTCLFSFTNILDLLNHCIV